MEIRQRWRDLGWAAVLSAAYIVSARVGLSLGAVSGVATSVWPPTGISLAALLILGSGVWPGVACGALLANLSSGIPVAAAVGIAIGNTLEACAGAYLLRRVVGFRNAIDRLDDVLALVLMAALLSTALSATIGVTSAWLFGVVPSNAFATAWWTWWVGDALGNLVIAPVLLVWSTRPRVHLPPRRAAEAATLLIVLVTIDVMVFTGGSPTPRDPYPEPYTVFPLLVWAALRFGQPGATAATAVTSVIAIWGTAHGWGIFAGATLHHSLVQLQAFTSVAAVMALVLGAVISDRRRAQRALQESETRYRQLVELSPDAIAVHREGKIAFINTAGFTMLGAGSAAQVIGRPILDFVHPAYRSLASARVDRMLEEQIATDPTEEQFIRLDGSVVDVEVVAMGMMYRDQPAVQVVAHDITRRKQAEEALRHSEAHFRSLIENSLDLIAVLDRRGMFRYVSPSTLRILGYAPEELNGKNGFAFVHPDDVSDIQKVYATAAQTAGATPKVQFRFRHKDGSWRFIEAIGNSVHDESGLQTVVINSRDITQRTVAERALQEEAGVSQALAQVGRELIASLGQPALLDRLCQITVDVLAGDYSCTWLFDAQSTTYVLAAGAGYTAEEWEALRVLRIPRTALNDLVLWVEREEVVHVHMAELPDPVLRAYGLQYGIGHGLFVALRRGREVIGMQAVYRRADREAFGARQLRIARGLAQLASLALEHARVVSELERANLVKSDFVATMSHELRTPLNVIMGYTALVLDGSFGELTPEQAESLQRVDSNAHALRDLIETTLDLSRLETGRVPIDVREVRLADLIDEVQREMRDVQEKPGLRVVWHVADDLPGIGTDPVKLKVVLKNLVGNAVKFTERGSVTVAARAANDGVEITVADTGVGIEPETLPIIFDAFRQGDSSSTRGYSGVGLGLYIVRQLLDLLGGTVRVESQPGVGSTFSVWLARQAGRRDNAA